MKTNKNLFACTALLALVLNESPAATTNLYAPYNTTFVLAIGSPSAASATNGTVTQVPGFTNSIGGNTGNAVHFDNTSSLDYGASSSYVPDFGNSIIGVKSNTFRLLFKPDFSGNPTSFRANFLGIGALGSGDGIYLGHSDNSGTPGLRINFGTGGFKDTIIPGGSGFAWNSSTWYYVAGSLDANGSMFYIRALTNGSQAFTSTLAYSGVNWGNGGFGSTALRVGGRWNVSTEGARGTIDEALIVNNAKWNADNFNYDFAVIIPEPTAAALVLLGLCGVAIRRLRR
jgi:hypothetical protein